MSENENIEAKLCSFIEGDLDAGGRAEIEKYLVAHPQYRALLAELPRTRGLLRQLPRASAPAELLETLSGQIERSALLGDDDRGTMQIRSSRIPQLTAWAAVLLLTVGLAAVVYRVLPSNKIQPELAMLKPAPSLVNSTQGTADDIKKTLPEVAQDLQDETSAVSARAKPGAPIAVAAPAAPIVAAAPSADASKLAMNGEKSAAAEAPAATSFAIASENSTVGAAVVSGGTAVNNGSSPSPILGSIVAGDATQLGQQMYVTLHATDARAAGAGVTQYLNKNGIQYESHAMDGSALVSAGPLPPLSLSEPYAVPGAASTSTATPPAGAMAFSRRSVVENVKDGLPAPAQAAALADSQNHGYGMAGTSSPSNAPASGDVIIIHNLTPDQAKQLASDLAVKVLPAQVDLLPTTQPLTLDALHGMDADSPLSVGESVRIIAHDEALPGVEAMNESQTIDADGNVTLPLVGKMKAAGFTREQLAQKIPDAYRDAKSPTTATWVIDRLHGDEPEADSALSLTSAATASPAGANSPTTAPSALAMDKDRQSSVAGVGASGGGGGAGGGSGGRTAGAVADQAGIDVTIRVVGQSVTQTQPSTQPIEQLGAPIAAPALEPATTTPATSPAR